MGRIVGEFVLVNEDKVERALHGTITRNGQLSGGVGDNAEEKALLAEYDRLGGFITKNGLKVKNGAFWDYVKKCPKTEPELSFMIDVEGEIVEATEEEATAVKQAKEKVEKIKAKKVKKQGKIKVKETYEE